MDHSLQTISYIADIGSLVVLMARRKLPRRVEAAEEKRLYKMICHVFHSADVSGSETLGRAGWCWGPGHHPAVVTRCLVSALGAFDAVRERRREPGHPPHVEGPGEKRMGLAPRKGAGQEPGCSAAPKPWLHWAEWCWQLLGPVWHEAVAPSCGHQRSLSIPRPRSSLRPSGRHLVWLTSASWRPTASTRVS